MATIMCLAQYAGAFGGLSVVFFGVFGIIENNKRQDKEIKKIKAEQKIIVQGLEGALDGLHQLGCNGKVTAASNLLNEHLNNAAHDD